MYSDGIVPGNPLAPDNQRKSVMWYFSFLEFGTKLAYEEVWLPLGFARSEVSSPCVCSDMRKLQAVTTAS